MSLFIGDDEPDGASGEGRERPDRGPSLAGMTPELLEAILAFLGPKPGAEMTERDRGFWKGLPFASKSFSQALHNLHIPFAKNTIEFDTIENVRQRILNSGPTYALGALTLRCGAVECDLTVLQGCPQLLALRVEYYEDKRGDLSAIPEFCPNLQSLTFFRGQITDVAPLARCDNLHTLELTDVAPLADVAPLSACRALHTLNIISCEEVVDGAKLPTSTTLHTLNLSGCEQLSNVEALAGCTALHTLDLSYCSTLHDLSPLLSCTALRQLNITGCELTVPEELKNKPELRIEMSETIPITAL